MCEVLRVDVAEARVLHLLPLPAAGEDVHQEGGGGQGRLQHPHLPAEEGVLGVWAELQPELVLGPPRAAMLGQALQVEIIITGAGM